MLISPTTFIPSAARGMVVDLRRYGAHLHRGGPRHSVRRSTRNLSVAGIAAWAGVTAVALAVGVLGVGGVLDLIHTTGSSVPDDPKVLIAGATLPAATGGGRALSSGRVLRPSQVPGGALGGPAPAAKAGRVVPFTPAAIHLPSGATAKVLKESVRKDGTLNIPVDPGEVGWWTGGAQPGEPYGTVVVAGHVDSAAYGLGVMSEMLHIRSGQKVVLSNGPHTITYQVTGVTEVTKAALAKGTDLFDQTVAGRLVLITCGGPFNRTTHHYRDNVIAVARPV
jgi:hypothetical protein